MRIYRLLIIPQTWLREPCRKIFITALPAKKPVEPEDSESPTAAIAFVSAPGTTYGGILYSIFRSWGLTGIQSSLSMMEALRVIKSLSSGHVEDITGGVIQKICTTRVLSSFHVFVFVNSRS